MGSTEVLESLSNTENGSFKENNSTKSNEYGCPNMKKKCYRKGSRICYTDLENITMLKKIPEKDTSQISIASKPEHEIYEKVDSYRSGESLFKTFTFEQTRGINDPETLKCIEFWKGVMQKNLAPIKCTLIESDKKKLSQRKNEKKKSLTDSKKLSIVVKPTEEQLTIDFAADQERIWTQALKEIKDRKLDKLKFYLQERCEYCRDPFTKAFADETCNNKKEQAAEIAALNDWVPNNESTKGRQNRVFSIKGIVPKIRRRSSTQTTEEKTDKSTAPETSRTELKPRGSILKPNTKQPTKHIPQKSSTNIVEDKNVDSMQVTEVQVPDIQCPCDSMTCVCPHKAAVRNSRTSLVAAARQNMVEKDKSVENIPTSFDNTCICKSRAQQPWETTICSTQPCVSTQPEIQESSSDFDLNIYRERVIKPATCVCGKSTDVVCSSEQCKNKNSVESLQEDIRQRQRRERDSCVCPDEEVPCKNETCSAQPLQKMPGPCLCRNEKPWCEVKCLSWSCRSNIDKIRKNKKKDDVDEEGTILKKFLPVKEVNSTCKCENDDPWNNIQCFCENCSRKHKPVSILQTEDKRRRSFVNIKKTVSQQLTPKLREGEEVIQQTKKTCICSTAEAWHPITCTTYCDTKEKLEQKGKKELPLILYNKIENVDTTCICTDKTLEPTCRAHKCENRNLEVDYPPPCICPKDQEDGKHFRCDSEQCKMKKMDKACICSTTPEVPCENITCVTKPPPSKTLKSANKKLNYDTTCVCKIRGQSTTQDVNCTAPLCPFRRKPTLKKKPPIAPKIIPYEEPPTQNVTAKKSKCVCKGDNIETICENIKCREKRSKITEGSADDEEPDICICNDNESDHEIICRQVQCRKVSITEGGVIMNDKCVCATMDSPCNEPFCRKTTENLEMEKVETSAEKGRPYCYICGHYDCSSTKNRTDEDGICGI